MAGRFGSGAVALGLVVLGIALSSCGSSSSPGTTSSVARQSPPVVGRTLRLHATGTTLLVTVRRVTFPLRGSGALLTPGDRAAGVDLSLRNVGHGVYDSSSESDVSLRTSGGEQAGPAFASQGACATSEVDFLKEVEPGELRSGCVVFDLARKTRPATVRFSPEGDASRGKSWLVPH